MENSPEKQLIPFLRNLADQIEKNEVAPDKMERIGKFFLTYKYADELNSEQEMGNEFSYEDLTKFCSLGWYVYCVLLKDKINISSDEE